MILNEWQQPKKLFTLCVENQPVADIAAPSMGKAIEFIAHEMPDLLSFDLAAKDADGSMVCDVLLVHLVGGREHQSVLRGMTGREALAWAKGNVPFNTLRVLVSEQLAIYNAPCLFQEGGPFFQQPR